MENVKIDLFVWIRGNKNKSLKRKTIEISKSDFERYCPELEDEDDIFFHFLNEGISSEVEEDFIENFILAVGLPLKKDYIDEEIYKSYIVKIYNN